MPKKYDFSGWATKVDLRCTDGRTIRKGAFKECDGQRVPLVWQHQHNDPENVLGHADLEYYDSGDVRAYCLFNESPKGQHGKLLVEHGDIAALSIFANGLEQRGGDVLHGNIREVSLVLAGANPGALIDFPVLAHSGEEVEDEAIIYTGLPLTLLHSDEEEEEEDLSVYDDSDYEEDEEDDEEYEDEDDEFDSDVEHADSEGETVGEVFETLTDKQKTAVYTIIGEALSEKDDSEGGEEVKHNVFDNDSRSPQMVLTHEDFKMIAKDAKRLGSFKEAVLEHMQEGGVLAHAVGDIADRNGNAVTYGIADIDYLFPDARSLNTPPEFIQRDMGWVKTVINGTHHTPFSRVKSMFANITMEEARAKGYIKGNLKKEEVFTLLKRTTDPQTIYKKQKMDRDDTIDITDFDVIRWLKAEMRMMLEEELARAILIGDGRSSDDDDHISHEHIRPILTDAELYTITRGVTAGVDDAATAKNFIRTAIKARKDYKGTGAPTLFTTEDWLAEMLLLEDQMGHFMYTSESQLATTLRVSKIVTVPVMEGIKIQTNKDVMGIIVNLSDYNIGADKGGETTTFEDFDIDYNQMKYLIETRCSGALVKPFSAIVLAKGATDSSTVVPVNRVSGSGSGG